MRVVRAAAAAARDERQRRKKRREEAIIQTPFGATTKCVNGAIGVNFMMSLREVEFQFDDDEGGRKRDSQRPGSHSASIREGGTVCCMNAGCR